MVTHFCSDDASHTRCAARGQRPQRNSEASRCPQGGLEALLVGRHSLGGSCCSFRWQYP